ncbi:M14 family metallopeptidase [Metabacillus fastidiosus]|uniref:M14 family metallopeptidase n=2 Tax=Metabacillus fastidiosus TaxID=1458 RepID=UPI003D283AC6
MKIKIKEEFTLVELSAILNIPIALLHDSNQLPFSSTEKIQANTVIQIPYHFYNRINNPEKFTIVDHFDCPNKMRKSAACDTILNTKKNYDSKCCYEDIEKIIEYYPFIKKEIIGYSELGKPIIELTIGQGSKKVHMNGSFHANEWITSAIMMKWLDEYLMKIVKNSEMEGYNALELYRNTQVSYVPMVNPDGVDLVLHGLEAAENYRQSVAEINNESDDFSNWKANIKGVDLNNQYPANWEIEKERKIPKEPAPRDYPGDEPLSEKEAITMANLVRRKNFDRLLAFHTQGEEIYWGYLNREPKEAEVIVNEFERVSQYKPVRTIDSHAGFRDWYVNEWGRPGYTVELGVGVNPLPLAQFDEIYEKSRKIFLSSLYM